MKNLLKYSSEIDWEYSINNKTLNKKFSQLRSKINRNHGNAINLKKDYSNIKIKNRNRNSYNYSRGSKKKVPLFFYYAAVFLLFFGFIFFLSVSISSSSNNIGYEDNQVNNIYNYENTLNLLKSYLFKEKKDDEVSIENYIVNKVQYKSYRVKKNETYKSIANKFNISIDTLYLANNIKKNSVLKAGKVLIIPNQNGRLISIKKNDSIFKIAKRYGIKWEKIVDSNNLQSSVIVPGMKLFIPGSTMTKYEKDQLNVYKFSWPHRGKITSYYGSRIDPFTGLYAFHTGIDIKGKTGVGIKSADDGKIIFAGWQKYYGNFVMIRHNNGFITLYGHLQNYNVKKNQYVKQGEVIGRLGSTGRSTGPHLHFEVRKNSKLVNPLKYL